MNFFTTEQQEKLIENGHWLHRDKDNPPVVKLFMPCTACTWLLSELNPEEQDIAFGLCDLGMGFPELGYVSLEELASVNIGDITVQRDDRFIAEYPMSVYAAAAREYQAITEDKFALIQASATLKAEM